MTPIFADHPFSLIPTPNFSLKDSKTAPDVFDELASEMALVHNIVIRGLNSIYLQAPHIRPADEKPFCRYIACWYTLLHGHHNGEETMFFPAVEEMTGVKGIMDTNIDQHNAFHDGIEGLKAYADAVVADTEKYEGSRVVALIDDFGSPLLQHLADEIPTILSLRQYGDKMAGLPKLFEEEADKVKVNRPHFPGNLHRPECCADSRNRKRSACLAWSGSAPTSTRSTRTAFGRAGRQLPHLSSSWREACSGGSMPMLESSVPSTGWATCGICTPSLRLCDHSRSVACLGLLLGGFGLIHIR